MKLRTSMAPPPRAISDIAISATTSVRATSLRLRLPVVFPPPSLSTCDWLARSVCPIGAIPKVRPASTESPAVKSTTVPSSSGV